MTSNDCLDDQADPGLVLNDPEWWITASIELASMQLPHRRHWYVEFTIPKKDGSPRLIRAPIAPVKEAQRRLNDILACRGGGVTKYAHAYIRRRSILSMATPHVGKAVVVKIDVKDFFTSITTGMIFEALCKAGVDDCVIEAVSRLGFDRGSLPTGAPTSPTLSNLFAAQFLDHIIAAICRSWRADSWKTPRLDPIAYTRYADDIVLSSDYARLSEIIPVIRHVLHCTGLRVNEPKVKVLRRKNSQVVCGVVVNERMGARRVRRNRLRGHLHSLLCDGLTGAAPRGFMRPPDGPLFSVPIPISRLIGEVDFCAYVNPHQTRYLVTLLRAVRHVHFGTRIDDDAAELIEITRRKLCSNRTTRTERHSSSTESHISST